MNHRALFGVLLLMGIISPTVFGTYITLSAVGGPFSTDSNILIIGKVFDNNGYARGYVDVNSYVVSDSNVASDLNYHGSVSGTFIRTLLPGDLAAGDYNIVAVDLNRNIRTSVRISVRSVKGGAITFNTHNPPFNKSTGEDINFTLLGKGAGNADTNVMVQVRLISDANNSQASPYIDVNANGLDQNVIGTSGLSQGLYYIDVNNGLALFPVPVFQFKGFLDIKDDQNNATNVFGPGKTVYVTAKAVNFDGNINQTITAIDVTVRNPSGVSTTVTCTGTAQKTCPYAIPADANSGEYLVSATITVGSDPLRVRRSFFVQAYQLKFFPQTFIGGDAGREKMPSVFPSGATVNFEMRMVNTATGTELSGSNDLNYRFCQDQNVQTFISLAGATDRNRTTATMVYASATPNYCVVAITAPQTQGTYQVTAEVQNGTETMRRTSVLVVQNYMIFSSPVSPDTFDPSSPTGKFTFYKGESVGFNPSYVDLNGSLNPKISAVRQIRVLEDGGAKTFTAAGDITWNSDKNILTLSAAAVNTLSGGFKQVEMLVDVNAADANASNITAFGMFKLQLLNLSATLWSGSSADANSAKSGQFGPPSVGLDENIFIRVSATTGSSTGISGATVQLRSMRNVDTWEEMTTSAVSSRVTDANGNAVLDIGTLIGLGKGSGGYMVEVAVTTSDGNSDTTEMFFDSRRFSVFLQPLDRTSGTQCQFAQGFRKDENASFIIRAFDPQSGFGAGDINLIVADSGALKLMYFGSPTKPQFPPLVDTNVYYDVNAAYPCMAQGGSGGGEPGSPTNLIMITLRKPNDTNWTTGFFDVSLQTDANGGRFDGNRETGRGFMRIQSFSFTANPNEVGQYGAPTAKPGAVFDVNTVIFGTTGDVNITAQLVDMMGGGKMDFGEAAGSDLNIGLRNPGLNGDCNATSCPLKYLQKSSDSNSQDVNVIRVFIPSGTKLQDYLIMLTATDSAGNTAEAEVFVNMKLFKLVNFGWYNSLFGTQGQDNPQVDWNVAGQTYDQVYWAQNMNQPPGAPPQLDFNFLINYSARTLKVDTNRHRNFGDNPTLAPGADINNMYRITDISRIGSQKQGIKFIRTSSFSTTESSFGYIGEYPADINFMVPLMVKDVNGSAIDANVIVSNVARFRSGSFYPENLAIRSCSSLSELQSCTISNDFNSWRRQTDGNGFVLLPVRIAKAGSRIMLEITVYTNTGTAVISTQKLQPFEGPTLDVLKYTVTTKIAGATFTVNFDQNYLDTTTYPWLSDLNITYPSDVNVFIGQITGTGGNNGPAGSLGSDRNWYFIRTLDGNLIIDDDRNISPPVTPFDPGNYLDGNAAEAGAISEMLCTDLNTNCQVVYDDGIGSPSRYLDANATDANIFDGNVIFYSVYSDSYGSNSPKADSNVQIYVLPSTLAGVPVTDTYSITNIRLENFGSWSTSAVSCTNCSNRTGPLLLNIGNLSTAGGYNVTFNLGVGSEEATENRVFFNLGGS